MHHHVQAAAEKALGRRIQEFRSVAGGDISQGYVLTLDNGRRAFLKCRRGSPRGFFPAEARGLEWLRQAKALRIPEVIAVSDEGGGFLLLEFLETGRQGWGFDEALGRGLATLHRASPRSFGLEHDNFIGSLPQLNQPCRSWVEFYVERRLRAQLELALGTGRAPRAWEDRFEALYRALPDFVPEEAPSRLHGDLWGGNLLVGPKGEPCLIDPAVYAGHREVDLAMMQLFGGFGSRVFAAYHEAFPLLKGHEQRVPLYQLYPLLVHLNLFGGSYTSSVQRCLDQLP